MALHTTRWSPDTCGCVCEYVWDDTDLEDQRTHTLATFVQVCPAHAALPHHAARWDALLDENPRKNQVREHLLQNFPALAQTVINQDGSTSLDFKPGVIVRFGANYVGKGRALTITLPGMTAAQRNTAQAAVDAKFGAGRITLQ